MSDPRKYAVVHCPPTLRPGDRVTVLGRFWSEDEASGFIGSLAATDPEGVNRGDYGIDGPEADFDRHAQQALDVVADDTGSIDRIH